MTRRSRLSIDAAEDNNDGTTTTTAPVESSPPPKTFIDGLPLPKMLVFDLDYTLWPFWCDTHVSPPLKPHKSGLTVRDSHGGSYGFYTDVAGIISSIKDRTIILGAASRTSAPDIANDLLTMLHIPGVSKMALSLFDYLEIYPGSKTNHFRKLQKRSGVGYEEMLFFDDESRNKNVEELGVVMHLVRDGVTRDEVDRGVEMWRRRNGRTEKKT